MDRDRYCPPNVRRRLYWAPQEAIGKAPRRQRSGWGCWALVAIVVAAYFIVIFIAMPALMPIIVRVLP